MKIITLLVALALLTGCANMTPREKQTTAIVGAVIVGAIIISANDGPTHIDNGCHGKCYGQANENE